MYEGIVYCGTKPTRANIETTVEGDTMKQAVRRGRHALRTLVRDMVKYNREMRNCKLIIKRCSCQRVGEEITIPEPPPIAARWQNQPPLTHKLKLSGPRRR